MTKLSNTIDVQPWQEAFSGTKDVADTKLIDRGALEEYLLARVEGFDRLESVRQFKGGQSNPTFQLSTPSQKFVLRRKPSGNLLPSAHAIEREFRILSALHREGFPVPKPIVLCEDPTILGTPFYLMEFVEGRIFWQCTLPDLPKSDRAAIYDSMNAVLARLHALDFTKLGLADFGTPTNYVARQIARWSKQYRASASENIPEMDQLMEWLPTFVPASFDAGIVHGDYRLDNVIVHLTEPKVIAVLDWELSTIGSPLADFTYHLMQWQMLPGGTTAGTQSLISEDLNALGIPTLDEYVTAYCRRTGQASLPPLDYYAAYNFFRLACIIQGILGRARDGTVVSLNAAQYANSVKPLAMHAWRFAQRAGA